MGAVIAEEYKGENGMTYHPVIEKRLVGCRYEQRKIGGATITAGWQRQTKNKKRWHTPTQIMVLT